MTAMPPLPGTSSRALRLAFGLLLAAFLLPPLPSRAEELSLLAGMTRSVDPGETSPAWQAMFRHGFLRNFAASLSWINEGHLKEHKRDGAAAQAWGRLLLPGGRATVGVGAGVYHYFDTVLLPGGDHKNVHGWAPAYSLTASYYPRESWFVQAAVNHIHPGGDFSSNTFLAGVGYRLWKQPGAPSGTGGTGPGKPAPGRTTGYEVVPFLGQVVVNSGGNEPGIGAGVEFRMGIDTHLDWTVSWLREEVSGTLDRTGLGTQIWLVDAFLDRRVTLGFGAGLYSFVDFEAPPEPGGIRNLDIAGLLTVTTSYRLSDRWFTRFNWNRVMSNDSRDSDDFLLGVGYRWAAR